eukprot:4118967-Prorocentrum_lima.AAC.1
MAAIGAASSADDAMADVTVAAAARDPGDIAMGEDASILARFPRGIVSGEVEDIVAPSAENTTRLP